MTPDFSILIVSWNTREFLRRCLESIEAGRGALVVEIIVVDNASHDGTPDMVRADFPSVTLIEPGANLGFSAGNNRVLEASHGRYLLLLNPDTEIVGDALERLVSSLDTHPAVGMVGPRLRYSDGSEQRSRHRLPTVATLALASTPLAPLAGPLLHRYYMEDRAADEAHPVGWLSGAALCLRRAVYEQVGGFDERFFMYFEETDWQRRIQAAGWSIWFLPDALIRHHEDAAGGQVAPLRQERFNRSRLRYAAKWHGVGWAHALRLWLLLLYTIEALKEAVKGLLGHKRGLRLARIRAYAALLRSLARERVMR